MFGRVSCVPFRFGCACSVKVSYVTKPLSRSAWCVFDGAERDRIAVRFVQVGSLVASLVSLGQGVVRSVKSRNHLHGRRGCSFDAAWWDVSGLVRVR